ncbi:GLUG motif-containing protein, partial [Lactonifactor longoviformis]
GLTGKIARVDLPVYQSPDDPKQPVPDASFDAASMLLTNVDAAMVYSVDGGKSWNAISGDTVDLSQDTVTAEYGIQVKKLKDEIKTEDSDPQIIRLTQAEKPSAPVVSEKTGKSITIHVVDGQEYAIKAKEDDAYGPWQSGKEFSGMFQGLTEGTEYQIITRVKGSGLMLSSEPSDPLSTPAENTFIEISTPQQLIDFGTQIGSGKTTLNARLMNDIDLTGITWQKIAPTSNTPFEGVFDGNNYEIKNVSMETTSGSAALFGTMENAIVKDLKLNITSVGKSYTAGLVSDTKNTLIENCHVSGSVLSKFSSAGALVGYARNTIIKNCSNSAEVQVTLGSSNGATAGLAAAAEDTVIENCYNEGVIHASIGPASGLVGKGNSAVKIVDSYNIGPVSASGKPAAGIICVAQANSEVINCYNTGEISGGNRQVAGIAAQVYNGTKITNCYNMGKVTGTMSVGGIVGLIYDNCQIEGCYNTGEVQGSSTYIGGIAAYKDTLYDNDAILSISDCYNEGGITGLTGSTYIGGLLGFASKVEISESYNKGDITGPSDGTGDMFVGGLAGQMAAGTIQNCYNSGGIICPGACGGGIAGFLYNGCTVTDCYNTGIVGGNTYTGGIAGYLKTNNTISRCYNLKKVSATGKYVGGIAGYLTADGSITDSYNAGDTFSLALSGNDYDAGILGYLTLGTLDNNYFLETEEVNQGIEAVGGSAGGVDTVTNTSSKTAEEF